ncbi:Heat shock protein 70 family [Parasponia andersonii]|uniref:Heat shock protein 70 family n=1 Tax=Parasponia andersonii TaxID=3476 RepID=A0A2P5BJ02_PARAD|nr:Heat shock protein 70 family [Parasponia andersonii]
MDERGFPTVITTTPSNLDEDVGAEKILRKLNDSASIYLKDKVSKAVITVPWSWDDSQRRGVKDAAGLAGFKEVHLMSEPSAAALAYGFLSPTEEILLTRSSLFPVFKFEVEEFGEGIEEVATDGDTSLGGYDFDMGIVEWLVAEKFRHNQRLIDEVSKDKRALQRLKETAEIAKVQLSSVNQIKISFPTITAIAEGPKHTETTLTRAKFEEVCSDLFDRLYPPVENVLRNAKVTVKDIGEVILVGGSTRIPAVQEFLRKITGKEPNLSINPEQIIALGAAIQMRLPTYMLCYFDHYFMIGILEGDVKDLMLKKF